MTYAQEAAHFRNCSRAKLIQYLVEAQREIIALKEAKMQQILQEQGFARLEMNSPPKLSILCNACRQVKTPCLRNNGRPCPRIPKEAIV